MYTKSYCERRYIKTEEQKKQRQEVIVITRVRDVSRDSASSGLTLPRSDSRKVWRALIWYAVN